MVGPAARATRAPGLCLCRRGDGAITPPRRAFAGGAAAPRPGRRYDAGMDWPRRLRLRAALAAALACSSAFAATGPKTVCTITINSADEKQSFRRHLPEAGYRFVELVEPGRPDWLRSACRSGVACDALIVSAHFDGDDDFYSEAVQAQEHLTLGELERLSCSDACPGLFSRLKEVYLFGCNTLNPQPQDGAADEVLRRLVREGRSAEQARRALESMSAAHGQSSRDRMRQIFKDVPVIYGFSSSAPPGPQAAPVLDRYLRATRGREFASGRASERLLAAFAPFGLAATPGMTDGDAHAESRAEMCRFADDRLPPATKLDFVHRLLQGQLGEARLHLDRIQRLMTALDDRARRSPPVAAALARIARDEAARARFLDHARGAELASVRVRYVNLARDLGWLSEDERRDELAQVLAALQSRAVIGVAELNLACRLNRDHRLDAGAGRRAAAPDPLDDLAHAALRACLGSADDRALVLQGLLGPDEQDARIAQAYLRHRPITDAAELRRVTEDIARMDPTEAQVRALDALARHYVSDRAVLERLVRLYAETPSPSVQSAVAGALIRADLRALAAAPLLRTLRESRHPWPEGDGVIDALIGRLQPP